MRNAAVEVRRCGPLTRMSFLGMIRNVGILPRPVGSSKQFVRLAFCTCRACNRPRGPIRYACAPAGQKEKAGRGRLSETYGDTRRCAAPQRYLRRAHLGWPHHRTTMHAERHTAVIRGNTKKKTQRQPHEERRPAGRRRPSHELRRPTGKSPRETQPEGSPANGATRDRANREFEPQTL